MKLTSKKFVFEILFFLFIGNIAFAEDIPRLEAPTPIDFKSKDWSFERKDVANLGGDLCVASTQKQVEASTWKFSLVYDSKGILPLTLVISTDAAAASERLILQTDSSANSKFQFIHASHLEAGQTTYWFPPVQMNQFYKQIRRDSSLKATYSTEAGLKSFYFSLSGSMSTLNQLAKVCNEGKEILASDFFDYLDKVKATPKNESPALHAHELSDVVRFAWARYLDSGREAQIIAMIDAKTKPLIDQEKRFLERAGLLTQEITNQNKIKKDLEDKTSLLKSQKISLEQNEKTLEAKLEPALGDLKAKESVYAPLALQAKAFQQDIQTADIQLNSSRAELSASKKVLAQLQNEINRATTDYNKCSGEVSNSDVNSLQRQVDDAREAFRRNSYNNLIAAAIAGDSTLAQLNSEYSRQQQNLNFKRNEIQNLQNALSFSRDELYRCMSSGCERNFAGYVDTIAFAGGHTGPGGHCKKGDVYCGGECHSSASACPDGTRPNPNPRPDPRPQPPHPTPPNPPQPPPRPPSCSVVCASHKSRYDQAQRNLDYAQNEADEMGRKLNDLANRINQRRAEIDFSVRQNSLRFETQLQNLEARLRQEKDDLAYNIRCRDEALRDLRSAQNNIPSAEKEITRAQNDVARDTDQLNRAADRFAQFRASTGFDQIKREYEVAYSVAADIRNEIANVELEIQRYIKTIASNIARTEALAAEINKLISTAAQNTQELQQIEAVLDPLRIERQTHQDALTLAQTDLLAQATAFKNAIASATISFVNELQRSKALKFYDWEL